MKAKFYLLLLVVGLSIFYGAYSTVEMLFSNRSPYSIVCEGILLDSSKIYAISNYERASKDTVYIHFAQSKAIMPSTLGYIYFDRARKEFVLQTNSCVFNPTTVTPKNYFLPFCCTMHNSRFKLEHEIFFGGNEVIPQSILLKRGIKFNTAVGTQENRVGLQFTATSKGMVLSTLDDGIKTKYLLQRDKENKCEVYFNSSVRNSTCPNVYFFDNTVNDTGVYTIYATPDLFSAKFSVKDREEKIVSGGIGSTPEFYLNGVEFSLQQKYSINFTMKFILYLILLLCFQIYFLNAVRKVKSPLIESLLSIRVLLNCIAFMAIPLFLTAYYLIADRIWYLPLVILLNFSFFLPKDMFTKLRWNYPTKPAKYFAWFLIFACPIVFWFETSNENLFGLVPILHCQKALLLLLFFITQQGFWQRNYLARIGFILSYSFLISVVTSDAGSFVYTGLALAMVELIRKFMQIKHVFLFVLSIAVAIFLVYKFEPDWLSKSRKGYRLVAPYVNPSAQELEGANQPDRETYSALILNLKNILECSGPEFNDLTVPGPMRSTMHSDFAFHWSLTFGGAMFLLLYLIITFMLVSNFMFLLYCSVRVCRIRHGLSFTFPQNRSAELVRFLVAFTMVQIIYPIASNLLLIPLTGQSVPVLSISIVEVGFLCALLLSLENMFNNPAHYVNAKTDYAYGDMKKSMHYGLFVLSFIFLGLATFKYFSVCYSPNSFSWKKRLSDEHLKIVEQIPESGNKEGLVSFAKSIIGDDKLVSVHRNKKPLLKNLASLYYANKAYAETIQESRTFSNSIGRMRAQMSVDTFFTDKQKLISGNLHPYGDVYSVTQRVNGELKTNVSNPLYNCIPLYATSINSDLTAESNDTLAKHLLEIGVEGNIGSIVIVANGSAGIVANSSFPLDAEMNSNQVYYFIGSLKKVLLAYCALVVDENFKKKVYGGKSFTEFIKYSDDYYAGCLLKELLKSHQDKFEKVLRADFDMPLYSLTDDGFLDAMPTARDFNKALDRNNCIYRQAIGQERPYQFLDVVQWYARINTMRKLSLNYSNEQKEFDATSITTAQHDILKNSLNTVLDGTAIKVGKTLKAYKIESGNFMCKTGTAEKADRTGNSASSFIIADDNYCIGIMLKGSIPDNKEGLAAKDLFNKLIPVFLKYGILKRKE